MGLMMKDFNPLIFTAAQNAAKNAAETTYGGAELFTHVGLIPALLATTFYLGTKAYDRFSPHQVVVNPPQNQGLLSWGWNKATSLLKGATKYVAIPEALSFGFHQLWAKAKWDGAQLNVTSFMRPFYEKVLPKLYAMWDKGDLNFSARDLVPDNVVTNTLATPAYAVRNLWSHLSSSQLTLDEQTIARTWYASGQGWAQWCAENYHLAARLVEGLYRSPECLKSADAFSQCMAQASNFSHEVVNGSPVLSTLSNVMSTAFNSWWQFSKDCLTHYPVQLFNLANAGLWGGAQMINQAAPAIPAHLAYYVEMGISAYLLYKLTKAGAGLAMEKIRLDYLRPDAPVQNNIHIQRGAPHVPGQQQRPAIAVAQNVNGAPLVPSAPGSNNAQATVIFNAPINDARERADGAPRAALRSSSDAVLQRGEFHSVPLVQDNEEGGLRGRLSKRSSLTSSSE